MRVINNAEFQKEYDKVTKRGDYIQQVRELKVGTSNAIPCINKEDGQRKKHGIVNEAYVQRERGNNCKFQTIVKENEAWVRRVE